MISNIKYGFFGSCIVIALAFLPLVANAAGEGKEIPKQEWGFQKVFGTYDRSSLQRGYQVYREVCSSCHSMKRIAFRNLEDLGYSKDDIKALAAEYMVVDEPNEEGEILERVALPSDYFPAPFENDQAAKFANNGALPPDLSLIVRAREGGADYIYALMNGYKDEAPKGYEVGEGLYWNDYFAGNNIAMAPPLYNGIVDYPDGSSASVEQAAKDVAEFLSWASDPHMEARKIMGIKAILFLFIFSCLMYAVKRRIWSDQH